jgi:UDP-N-acetylmuramoyl-tripeptide--D-alanyl-D-alanine ligase
MRINLSDIFNLTDSVIYNPDNFKSVFNIYIDSRTIKKGSLYVAIKGDKFDGHNFINDAIANGASSVLISKNELNKFNSLNCTVITVPNTTSAYGELANIYRNKFKGKIVSITGSNGKTTTKEILATILEEKFRTEKTEANNNNHIGIPKTLLATKDKTEILVLEHGTNHFNEIEYTATIAEPDYSLITNISDSHLEYLIDKAGVYKEKSSLFNATLKNSGTIFVNNDDPIIKSETRKIKNKITFGFKGKPDVKGKVVGFTDDGRTKLSVKYSKKEFVLELPLFGISNAKNFLAAITVAIKLGLTNKQIKSGVKKVEQVRGRLFVEPLQNLVLIDDTYNSNPSSMIAAIELLNKIKTYKTKTLIVGDMFELGKNAKAIHEELSGIIIKSKIQNIFTHGKLMKSLSNKLKDASITSKHFLQRRHLKSFIAKENLQNQVILVKGSRGMKMEEFVNQIRSITK